MAESDADAQNIHEVRLSSVSTVLQTKAVRKRIFKSFRLKGHFQKFHKASGDWKEKGFVSGEKKKSGTPQLWEKADALDAHTLRTRIAAVSLGIWININNSDANNCAANTQLRRLAGNYIFF